MTARILKICWKWLWSNGLTGKNNGNANTVPEHRLAPCTCRTSCTYGRAFCCGQGGCWQRGCGAGLGACRAVCSGGGWEGLGGGGATAWAAERTGSSCPDHSARSPAYHARTSTPQRAFRCAAARSRWQYRTICGAGARAQGRIAAEGWCYQRGLVAGGRRGNTAPCARRGAEGRACPVSTCGFCYGFARRVFPKNSFAKRLFTYFCVHFSRAHKACGRGGAHGGGQSQTVGGQDCGPCCPCA